MRRPFIAAALALLAATPALAQVRVVGELGLPSAPAIAPANFTAPSYALPALALSPLLPAPSLTGALATPVPAAAAPVTAKSALVQTGAALSAAAKENADQGDISRRAFDAGAKTPAETPAVAGQYSSLGRPALEEVNSPRGRVSAPVRSPVAAAVHETVEVGAMMIPLAFVSFFVKGMLAHTGLAVPGLLGVWALGFWAMRGHLAGLRSTVVGGWQASHDQKYRVDYGTGKQRDVRGQKYGSDRYEEWAPGPVGRRATAAMALAAAAAAAAFVLL